jgi:hypothetical protein
MNMNCRAEPRGRSKNYVPIQVGARFGSLTVLGEAPRHPQHRAFMIRCVCDCGTHVDKNEASVRAGRSKSCGCLRRESTRERGFKNRRYKDPEGSHDQMLWRKYKASARARGHELEHGFNEFIKAVKSRCHYCGSPPKPHTYANYYPGKIFHYNGLDRVDSFKGYTKENCVPACVRCNVAKSSGSVEDFLEWAHQLVSHQQTLMVSYATASDMSEG